MINEFFEILISGIGDKKIEKPLVFILMLISYLFFMVVFVALIIDGYKENSPEKFILAMFIFFLSGVCVYFMKKCFKGKELSNKINFEDIR